MQRKVGDWNRFWSSETAPTPSAESDSWYDVVWRYGMERWHEQFARAPGKRMLECGCGSGRMSAFMAARGFDCTLVDYSDGALDLARRRFQAAGLQARFIRADMNRLGLGDSRFDLVFCGGVLEFFDDLEPPMTEIARVLVPGGMFGANVIPLKFSVQTLADFERTLAYGSRNLARGRWREALRPVRMASRADGIRPWTLGDFERACAAADLGEIEGRVTGPFPQLALPRFLHRRYARMMRASTQGWRRFDDSQAAWTRVWGLGYSVLARKGKDKSK